MGNWAVRILSVIHSVAQVFSCSCHIDTAWVWLYRVNLQKVVRSWSTQIGLLQRYPEHRFASSSAQQYKWLEELYPSLFGEALVRRVNGISSPSLENDAKLVGYLTLSV